MICMFKDKVGILVPLLATRDASNKHVGSVKQLGSPGPYPRFRNKFLTFSVYTYILCLVRNSSK